MVSQVTDKLKELQHKMIRFAQVKKTQLPNGDYVLPENWSHDFTLVLRLSNKPYLTPQEKKYCNDLYKKYLGYIQ